MKEINQTKLSWAIMITCLMMTYKLDYRKKFWVGDKSRNIQIKNTCESQRKKYSKWLQWLPKNY